MSALLMLCVALFLLGTPGRGARHWEPCTGKVGTWGSGVGQLLWSWREMGLDTPLSDTRSIVWPHQIDTGHTTRELDGCRGQGEGGCAVEWAAQAVTRKGLSGLPEVGGVSSFKELTAAIEVSHVLTCLAAGEGRAPASGMKSPALGLLAWRCAIQPALSKAPGRREPGSVPSQRRNTGPAPYTPTTHTWVQPGAPQGGLSAGLPF